MAKERPHDLKAQREAMARDLARARTDLPTVEELMPPVREKLREIEATLRAIATKPARATGVCVGGLGRRGRRRGGEQ